MTERRIDILDVENVIRYGRITDHIRPARLWRFVLNGSSADGDPITCVVEIDGVLVLITVIALRGPATSR